MPAKAASNEPGNVAVATGCAHWPRAACQNRLAGNISRHQRRQRNNVRRLTQKCSSSRLNRCAFGPSRSTGKRTTHNPKNTLRPKNRSEGGVARRRQPSTAQQKLARRA
jgi:hypothetical protein